VNANRWGTIHKQGDTSNNFKNILMLQNSIYNSIIPINIYRLKEVINEMLQNKRLWHVQNLKYYAVTKTWEESETKICWVYFFGKKREENTKLQFKWNRYFIFKCRARNQILKLLRPEISTKITKSETKGNRAKSKSNWILQQKGAESPKCKFHHK